MSSSIFSSKTLLSELENALQLSLKTTSKFGSDCTFVECGEGNGITTIVGLLTADWVPSEDGLPSSFAIKISSAERNWETEENNHLVALASDTEYDDKQQKNVDYHNRECLIFERFKQYNVTGVKMPKVYAIKQRDTINDIGYIIMEYIPGCASVHMNNNLPYDATIEVLKSVASVHMQGSLFSEEEQIAMKGQPFGTTFKLFFEPNMMVGLKKAIKDFGGEGMKEETEQMEKVIDEMAQRDYVDFTDNVCDILGTPRLLCHGDVWMCNMLWKIDSTGSDETFTLKALIDYQGAQFTCPAMDLVRLYTGCCSGKQREEHWEDFTRLYWNLMNDHYKGQFPYTYDQLIESYKRMFPLAAYIVAASIGAVGPVIVEKQKGEEAKNKARESLLEKQLYILRDIIKYHRRNMDLLRSRQ